MRMKTSSPQPLIQLSWTEYKKRSVIERFPLSVICGILILSATLGFLHDRSLAESAIDKPLSYGLAVIEEDLREE